MKWRNTPHGGGGKNHAHNEVAAENDEPDSPTVAGVDIARSASLDSEAAMACLDTADDDERDSPTDSGVDIARNAVGAVGPEESKNVCSQLANTTHRGGRIVYRGEPRA